MLLLTLIWSFSFVDYKTCRRGMKPALSSSSSSSSIDKNNNSSASSASWTKKYTINQFRIKYKSNIIFESFAGLESQTYPITIDVEKKV